MAKAFFRWLRGELNGYYLQNINHSFNLCTEDIKRFLIEFNNQQFQLGRITNKNLYGIGKTAGVFLPRLAQSESASSLRMTESHIENGYEFSERGLFHTEEEYFEFFHCIDDSVGYFIFVKYDDINNDTDEHNRSSLVGDEPVIGYITSDSPDIFNEDGSVKEEYVSLTPPYDGTYNNFYGNDFLFLSEKYAENMRGEQIPSETDIGLTGIRLSESYDVDGSQFSERGVWNIDSEEFFYIHLGLPNEEATNLERSTLVGNEQVIGYIDSTSNDIFDEEGNVKPEMILPNPPEDIAYNNFYGDQFLYLSEGDGSESDELIKIRMTDSEIYDGEEISERGLYKIPIEFLDDINLLATPELRSSLVGKEKVIGYISEYTENVVDDEGMVNEDKYSIRKPSAGAYSEFFGNQFLFLSEAITTYKEPDPELYIELYKALQWIRYNGCSVESLCRITQFACPEGLVLIKGITVAEDGRSLYLEYYYDSFSPADRKQQRLSLWQYIIETKFPQITLVENEIS